MPHYMTQLRGQFMGVSTVLEIQKGHMEKRELPDSETKADN